MRGRCGGADDGGAAAAQPNEWIPAPSITCNRHHSQTLYTKSIFSMDAIDSSLTASAQPLLQPLMSHKPKPSTVNLVLQPPAAQNTPAGPSSFQPTAPFSTAHEWDTDALLNPRHATTMPRLMLRWSGRQPPEPPTICRQVNDGLGACRRGCRGCRGLITNGTLTGTQR